LKIQSKTIFLVLTQIANGTHNLAEVLKGSKRPMIILGSSVFDREDGADIHNAVRSICDNLECEEGWNAFNIMHKSASTVGALDLGYKSGVSSIKANKPKLLFLVGADAGAVTADDVSLFIFQSN